MQLEFCHTALSFRVIKTSPGVGATELRVEASFGGLADGLKGLQCNSPDLPLIVEMSRH